MSKMIKNEQWTVKQLISMIKSGNIIKPKYQRKKKWDVLPKKDKVPNEKDYILFLYETNNSVHAITFGENSDKTYTNIDGNNRINALCHFLERPFELFPEHLQEINQLIDSKIGEKEIATKVKQIFADISYNALMKFKYNIYFNEIKEHDIYTSHLKILRDDFESCIENLQSKLRVNASDSFDTDIKINVNLFQGYSTDELCQVFENINKYNTTLTDDELLACILYNVNNFRITDEIIESAIKVELIEIYKYKSDNEKLSCYVYDSSCEMNAYDFIYGFQNYAHGRCRMIENIHQNKEGVSLFCKIYKLVYKGSFDTIFTTQHVNDFINKMLQVIDILNVIFTEVNSEKLTYATKMFDDCNKKFYQLKKNTLYLIIASIIGFLVCHADNTEIIVSIKQCMLYHFFVKDISSKEQKDEFSKFDSLAYKAGGSYIDNKAAILYANPRKISSEISTELMHEMLLYLCSENVKACSQPKMRRKRKFFEKTLMKYYYKQHVPVAFLNNEFWMEHIFPFSCKYSGNLDIDRLGNIVPIIGTLNIKRGNRPISEYKKHDVNNFMKYLADIIPDDVIYDTICCKNMISDNDTYNTLCTANERKYIENFLKTIY